MNNLKIILHVTFRYMMQNKKRMLFTLFGIILTVVLVTSVFLGKDTVFYLLERTSAAQKGNWHYEVTDLTSEQYENLKQLDFIKTMSISHSLGVSDFPQGTDPEVPYLEMKEYQKECFELRNIGLTEGRLPANDSEVLISEEMALHSDVTIGSVLDLDFFTRQIQSKYPEGSDGLTVFSFHRITLKAGETKEVPPSFPYFPENDSFLEFQTPLNLKKTVTVTGIVKRPYFEDGSCYTVIGLLPNDYVLSEGDTICGYLDSHRLDSSSFYMEMNEAIGIGSENQLNFNDMVLMFSGTSSDSAINTIVNGMVVFFLALITAASAFLIYNMFSISYESRCRYLGILSCTGATGRQKRFSVYFESLILLIPGLPLGILLGMGVVKLVLTVLSKYLIQIVGVSPANAAAIPVSLKVTFANMALVILFTVLIVMVSSLLPAFKVSRIAPIEAVRSQGGKKIRAGHFTILSGRNLLFSLARKNLKGHKGKTGSIVCSLTVLISVFVISLFGSQSLLNMIDYKINDCTFSIAKKEADFTYNATYNGMDGNSSDVIYASLSDELRQSSEAENIFEVKYSVSAAIPHVEVYSEDFKRTIMDQCSSSLNESEFQDYYNHFYGYSNMAIMMISHDRFVELAKSCGADTSDLSAHGDHIPTILYDRCVLSPMNLPKGNSNKTFEISHASGLLAGDVLPFYCMDLEKEAEVEMNADLIGIAEKEDVDDFFFSNTDIMFMIMDESAWDTLPRGVQKHFTMQTDVKMKDLNSPLSIRMAEMSADLLLGVYGDSENTLEILDMNNNPFVGNHLPTLLRTIIRVISICFVVIVSLICTISLINTIRALAESRQGELAGYRSIGLDETQLRKMILSEHILLYLRGFALSIVFALPLALVIKWFVQMNFGYFEMPFPILPGLLACAVSLAVILFGVFAFYRPARHDSTIEVIRKNSL